MQEDRQIINLLTELCPNPTGQGYSEKKLNTMKDTSVGQFHFSTFNRATGGQKFDVISVTSDLSKDTPSDILHVRALCRPEDSKMLRIGFFDASLGQKYVGSVGGYLGRHANRKFMGIQTNLDCNWQWRENSEEVTAPIARKLILGKLQIICGQLSQARSEGVIITPTTP